MRAVYQHFVYKSFWLFLLLFGCHELAAAQVASHADNQVWEQVVRFWSFTDPAVRYAVIGSLLMGIFCGLLGSFIVVRKLSLVGDTLSHAVLPGVMLGYLWNMSKDPFAIFIGATLAGLIGTVVVNLIKQTTHIKEDSALGMVLAGFYGVGICLFTMIQRMDVGSKSGLDKFMFGQAAALSANDIYLMAGVTVFAVLLVFICYKELLVVSFDGAFARAIGIPYQVFHYMLMLLLAFAIVVAIQATGVVLVSALLIIPAATAYLLTDRMHRMLFYAAGLGALSGLLGAFFSFLGSRLPTGPFMVVSAALFFALAFFWGPRHGLIPRWWRQRKQEVRIGAENTLKAIYQVLEKQKFAGDTINLQDLALRRNVSMPEIELEVKTLLNRDLVTLQTIAEGHEPRLDQDKRLAFTPQGWERACQIVRNHRLWELYLTHSAAYEVDHVHDDAEKIEHILGEKTVRQLERHLNHPATDPHGKLIPTQEDIDSYYADPADKKRETLGYPS